jgi:murein endopeptidase
VRFPLAILLLSGVAGADNHVVERGETLEHVAQAYGCTVGAVLTANELKTTLVPVGTIVRVPNCSLHSRARVRPKPASSEDDKARTALDVIDGTTWVEPTHEAPTKPKSRTRASGEGSIGDPWNGKLRNAEHLDDGEGYEVRRTARAYGVPYVIEHLRHVISEVRALYPDVHALAIGDLSAEHGGKISDHHSHQSGVDVDVGFYFTRVPDGYPEQFAAADAQLDLEATWALLMAFARTADLDTGVEMIFLDRAVQARLYQWGKAQGTPDDELAFLLQYPRDANTGLVRHWPNHTDHMHVRFKSQVALHPR